MSLSSYFRKPLVLVFISLFFDCSDPVQNYETIVVLEDSLNAVINAQAIVKNTTLELAEGLEMTLWATDSLAPDPIAMSIDDFGNIYLTRTNRQKNSEFDIRGHRDWMTASIGLQSVEDRRNFLRETFSTERSNENDWLKDLNGDTLHDWRDLMIEQEEVWKLEDRDGDGMADASTRIINDFNEEITDVAGALLVRRNDMFVGVGPDMWRIFDRDKNGIPDSKKSISHGYAVHIGFGGHGMSGAVEGPDGKIYWGIGDVGANITALDGTNHPFPNQGVLVRSYPDGSDFEVFAAGLRNTHEFAFDQYGNIIGADNDGDHRGEKERLVHIVEGSDQGWRTNWQFGKYTDPKNNVYKVWMEEKLHIPRWEGQAAYIMPPIANYHNGPTGMIYNPGTALGSRWTNKFFVVEFTGTPNRSPIWAFSLKPNGATFELDEDIMVAKGILPTGIRFGPDGALYAADWINGWDTKNYGRIWRVDVAEDVNDLRTERHRTFELMQLDYDKQNINKLYDLLFYPDMRIRQKAQFELAYRGKSGKTKLLESIGQKENQLARIHGIWGLGQMINSGDANGEDLINYLKDSDPEIVAQTLKVLGDTRYDKGASDFIPLLTHENDRVKFFAAQALGRARALDAVPSIISMLEQNNDTDLYLRHAGMLALARMGDVEAIAGLSDHDNTSLRIVGVLALRRLKSERIVAFLDDESDYIVTEAARAIHDDFSIAPALDDLAAVLGKDRYTSEPLLRRAISAALRVGGDQAIDQLIDFAMKESRQPDLRAEALLALSTWASPSVHDRVDGRYRGIVSRDDSTLIAKVEPRVAVLIDDRSEEVVVAVARLIGSLKMTSMADMVLEKFNTHPSPEVRISMIRTLEAIEYPAMQTVVLTSMNDENENVRASGLPYLSALNLTAENLSDFIDPIFVKGTVEEQQKLLKVMGEMPVNITREVFADLTDKWIKGNLAPAISLDIVEAVEATGSTELIAKIAPHRSRGNATENFKDVLYGGDRDAGNDVFWSNAAAQCSRCHDWQNTEGSVGPSLRGVASRLTREQLLESLIEPSALLATGFGSVYLKLKDGSSVTGVLLEENEQEITLKTSEAEPLEIPVARIESRQNLPSSMPPMGSILTKREIRDLVEFLSSLE